MKQLKYELPHKKQGGQVNRIEEVKKILLEKSKQKNFYWDEHQDSHHITTQWTEEYVGEVAELISQLFSQPLPEMKVLVDGEWVTPSKEFMDTVAQIDKAISQPLDNKELREKIKDYASKWFCKGRTYGVVPISKNDLLKLEEEGEQILALLPDIEEEVRAEHDIMVKCCVDEGNDAYKRGIEEGRGQGRKEVVEWVCSRRHRDDYGDDYLWMEDAWEAKLKEWVIALSGKGGEKNKEVNSER